MIAVFDNHLLADIISISYCSYIFVVIAVLTNHLLAEIISISYYSKE